MPGTFFDSLSMRFEEGKLLSQRFMKYFVFGCTCLSLVYLSLTCRMKKSNAKKQSWLKKKKDEDDLRSENVLKRKQCLSKEIVERQDQPLHIGKALL